MTNVPLEMPRVRPPGPRLGLAIAVMVAGFALGVPTFIAGIAPIVRTVTSTSPRITVPGTVILRLQHGTWTVYEERGHVSIGSSFAPDNSVTISPDDVTVAPVGSVGAITVRGRSGATETLTDNGDRFVGAARFDAPATGDYRIAIRGGPATVVVARSLDATIRSVIGWFLLAGLGGLVFVAGLILVIVGSVRRGRARRAAMPYGAAYATGAPVSPPGWHPDPWGSGRLRYWDGARWTEHLH